MVTYTAAIDRFVVLKNGTNFVTDNFADNSPPPSLTNEGTGAVASYSTTGTFQEAVGRGIMLASEGADTTAIDDAAKVHVATLNSDVSTDLALGLKIDDNFQVQGLFALTNLTQTRSEYGIRLSDQTGGAGGDDVVSLSVRMGTDGVVRVQLIDRNPTSGRFDILSSVVLDPGSADQIQLQLNHDANTGVVTASFSLFQNGSLIANSNTNLANSARIFGTDTATLNDDEVFTRAQFFAFGVDDTGSKLVEGDENANTIVGTTADETIVAYRGDDIISGGGGTDFVNGREGNDTLLLTGNRADYDVTQINPDTFVFTDLRGGTPDGVINVTEVEQFQFQDGTIPSSLLIPGDSLDNLFIATSLAENFDGGEGSDTVSYENATALVMASLTAPKKNKGFAAGDTYVSIENLKGSNFNDTLTGDAGDNVIEGGLGADKMNGLLGIDTATYANAATGVTANLLKSKENTGEAFGDKYTLIENLVGSALNDVLTGNKLANKIQGGDGDDVITGSGGLDVLEGGTGADQFRFLTLKDGADTILDFNPAEDTIAISKKGFKIPASVDFGALEPFDFATNYFVSNTTGEATKFNGQFIYNTSTDQLLWDADGAGIKKSAIVVATFATDIDLNANHFVILA